MKTAACLTTLVTLLAGPTGESAWADTIFTDFASGNSYDAGNGDVIGKAVSIFRDDSAVAIAFNVPAGDSYSLESITIALSYSNNYPSSATATIALDTNSGGFPGSTIDTFTSGVLPAFGSTSDSPITLNAVHTDVLQGGTNYWIAVSTDYANQIEWNLNTTNTTGTVAQSVNGGSTWLSPTTAQTLGAFSIQATPQQEGVVPEPSTLALFGLGLLGFAFRTPAVAVILHRTMRSSHRECTE